MKYILLPALALLLMSSCKKNSCVQCAKQVLAATQTTTVAADYNIVYVEFCGKQADTAMSSDPNINNAFVAEQNIVAYSCYFNK